MINSFIRYKNGYGFRELVAFAVGLTLVLASAPTILHAASGNVTKIDFTSSPQTIDENTISSQLTTQTQNASSTSEQVSETTTLNLSSDSPTGAFSESETNWATTTTLTMNTGTANKNFYYRDSTPGTYTLTVTAEGESWAPATQQIIIEAVEEPATGPVSRVDGSGDNDDAPNAFATIQEAIDDADTDDGDIILLTEDVSTSEQITIDKEVTLDGAGYTISPTFTKTSNSNNAIIGIIGTNNVTVTDVTLDGSGGTDLHGINIYESTGITIDGVTTTDNRSGVVVGNSEVIINDIVTSGNIWHAINVDQTTSMSASLTITGESSHDETSVPHIFVDDISESVTVTDSESQYDYTTVAYSDGDAFGDNTNAGVYTLAEEEVAKTTQTATVRDDTASGENDAGGWLFNRDQSTQSEFEFNTDASVIGDGSLYVFPIDGNINGNSDKFIGEYFALEEIANIDSFSYDFQLGSSSSVSDANEFYLNVYANYGESDDTKYYDCKYDVVPTTGSTDGFTTVTFDPTQSYPVTTRGGGSASPYTCPSIPAAMDLQSPNSTIRMFAINVGDTSANDTGVSGYFDNVVFETDTTVITYDFEAGFEGETSEITVATTENPDGSKTGTVNGDTIVTVRNEGEPNVVVTIFDGTQVTGPADWDGTIVFVGDVAITEIELENGDVYNVITAIELGYENGTLSFDQPVKIVFENEAGNRVGYMQNNTFVEIAETCDSETNPTLASGAECKIDVDGDLVVWTTHFTTFVTLGEQQVSVSTGGNSAGGGSSSSNNAPQPQVLGASTDAPGQCGMLLKTYMNVTTANNNWEVMKLQAYLVGQGYFSVKMTGVFDAQTDAAVKLYQAAHSEEILQPWIDAGLAATLPPTGNVYLFTRWHINNTICPGSEMRPVLN